MTNSIRDQLMRLGFAQPESPPPAPRKLSVPETRPAKNPVQKPDRNRSASLSRSGKPERASEVAHLPKEVEPKPTRKEEIDLAKAYALRERREREERELARRETEARAAEKRLRKIKLRDLTREKSLNDPNAEHARHFPHLGKIKRIYVTEAQLLQLNAGDLGIVTVEGRYLLVSRETALAVRAIADNALVLLLEPGESDDTETINNG